MPLVKNGQVQHAAMRNAQLSNTDIDQALQESGSEPDLWNSGGAARTPSSGQEPHREHDIVIGYQRDYLSSSGPVAPVYAEAMRPEDVDDAPELINLTPHVVRLVGDEAEVELAPAGPPARVVLRPDRVDGEVRVGPLVVPLKRTAASPLVTGVPDRKPGVLFIVARAVAEALPDRDDLVYPHDTVRDDRGVVIGCRSLARPSVND